MGESDRPFEELQRIHVQCLSEAQERIQARLGVRVPLPAVTWDLTGLVAGRAIGDYHIRLNPRVAQGEGLDYLVTVKHEFAHTVVSFLRKNHQDKLPVEDDGRAHGRLWREVMRLLGLDPRRTHSYQSAKPSGGMAYRYRCSCSECWFSQRRVNKIRQGVRYRCPKCKSLFEDTGIKE